MAKRLEYDIVTDASKGIAGLKQFAGAAKKAMGDVNDSVDDTTTSAQKLAKAFSGLADELETEMKGAAKAADALGKALGPELTKRIDVDQAVGEFHKLGAEFSDIEANAGELAASLKKLDGVQMAGATRGLQDIEESTKRAKGGVDDIGKSADSSKGALANMIGNSAQDLGSLGGAAGSAGVLIGQMAEYMADAGLEGEKFGKVVSNFAAVAGPAAALGIVISTVSGFMAKQAEEAQAAAERTKEMGDAMAGAADDALGMSEALKSNIAPLRDIQAGNEIFGNSVVDTVNKVGRSIPLLGRLYQDTSVDVVAALEAAGLSIYQFTKAVSGTDADRQKFLEDLKAFHDAGLITADQWDGIAAAVDQYTAATKKARQAQRLMNVDLDETNALIAETKLQDDPFSRFHAQWDSLIADLRDGKADIAGTADTINFLAEQLGKDPGEVISLALGKVQEAADAFSQAIDDAAKGLDDWGKSTEDAVLASADMQIALDDMAGLFPTMTRGLDAIGAAFALKDAPLKLSGEIRDISLAIGNLSEDMKGIKVGDVLAGSVKADKFLDAMDKLRPDIQTKIAETFADPAGGAAAATKLANSYIDQIVKELGGRFTREQVAKMLGLDDLTATIKIAIDLKSLAEAQTLLELFASLPNTDPALAMQLRVDLDAGLISPAGVIAVIQSQVKGTVKIPSEMLPADEQSRVNAKTDAENFYSRNKVQVATETVAPSDAQMAAIKTEIESFFQNTEVGLRLSNRAFDFLFNDAGGTIRPPGGIVAERRPEIVNGRYLVTQPTVVPPGTRVTSGRQTARILRTRGTRGLRKYDSGGTVAGARTVNVNINAGVVGNRYDVMKAVQRAHLDKLRLFGERG